MTTKIEATDIIAKAARVIESYRTVEQIQTAKEYLRLVRRKYPFIIKAATDMMCERQKWVICVAEEGS